MNKKLIFLIFVIAVLILFLSGIRENNKYKFMEMNKNACNNTFYRSKDECLKALDYLYNNVGMKKVVLSAPQPPIAENKTGFWIFKIEKDAKIYHVFKNGTVIAK